jgi:hypothetical protein
LFFFFVFRTENKNTKQMTKSTILPTSRISITYVIISPIKKRGFTESFNEQLTIEENGSMYESGTDTWWVNSGGRMIIENGTGKTIQGDLPASDFQRQKYEKMNPEETDNGLHPQNIFRLVTKSKWLDFQQEVHFKINTYYKSNSIHRMASNGVLLFNHYLDGDNLYYVGIRVDGSAIVKKKKDGVYYTMESKRVFPGKYDTEKNPNLLPLNTRIGLRSEISNQIDGTVSIKLFVDRQNTGKWELVINTIDDGKTFGGSVIASEGYAGIRTDFMDAEFEDYSIEEY